MDSEVAWNAKMIESGELFCADVASSMLAGEGNEVRPFLVFGWAQDENPLELGELSLMDAAPFHRREGDGFGKTLMMAFVCGALNGDSVALEMMGSPDGTIRSVAPAVVFHVSEAWVVKRATVPGESMMSPLPEGESVSSQPDRQEVVLIQAHVRGRTHMGQWPLVVAESGRKHFEFKHMTFDGEFFGRLAIRPATSD